MLPDLPKKINQKEADFGLKFREWIEAHPLYTSSFEMKHTNGKNYINFDEVKLAQINYGRLVKSKRGALIRTKGIKGLPDYIYLREEPAFVVIKYPKFFCLIDIEDFDTEKITSKKKSLTIERAKAIATEVFNL